jgi:hypothetical protein
MDAIGSEGVRRMRKKITAETASKTGMRLRSRVTAYRIRTIIFMSIPETEYEY